MVPEEQGVNALHGGHERKHVNHCGRSSTNRLRLPMARFRRSCPAGWHEPYVSEVPEESSRSEWARLARSGEPSSGVAEYLPPDRRSGMGLRLVRSRDMGRALGATSQKAETVGLHAFPTR
jgi:hypothetical protein